MSNASRARVLALALAMVCSAPLGLSLGAQTVAEIEQQMKVVRQSLGASNAQLEGLRTERVTVPDDSLVESAVTVHFPRERVSARELESLRDGIRLARTRLDAEFGLGTATLLDGVVWRIEYDNRRIRALERANFVEGINTRDSRTWGAPIPLSGESVSEFMSALAERQLVRRNSTVAAFAGGAFSLTLPEAAYHVARKQLTISPSSVARRCAEGATQACRTILDDRAMDRWYLAEDTLPRRATPVPRGVHASLVTVAIELGGARAIETLANPSSADDALTMLTKAAGVTQDSLLHTWNARMRSAAERRASVQLPFTATAIIWSGIFLFAATRRRPK